MTKQPKRATPDEITKAKADALQTRRMRRGAATDRRPGGVRPQLAGVPQKGLGPASSSNNTEHGGINDGD